MFSRTVILFSSIMLLSFFSSIIIYFIFLTRPFAVITAYNVSQQVNGIKQALPHMGIERQQAYLQQLAKQGYIYLLDANGQAPGYAAENIYQDTITQQLSDKLSDNNISVMFQMKEEPQIIWVPLTINDKSYWLGSPLSKLKGAFPWNYITQLIVVIILTMIASWIIARRVKRPLQQLELAAIKLGQGQLPEPLKVQGPKELRVMSETFNKMAQDVERLAEDRNLLMAGISHDLRTPLARLRVAAEMLGKEPDPQLTQGMVQDIEDMDSIIGQFLTFVRDGTDEPTQAGKLNDLIIHLAERYARAGKTIELDLMQLPESEFKPVAMQRMLMNLIDNAWYYGKQGVAVTSKIENGQIVITVVDRGPGIPLGELGYLCQPFTRRESSRSNSSGAGLGLAIVQRIVQWHHGKFSLSNRKGGGLEAYVAFPTTAES